MMSRRHNLKWEAGQNRKVNLSEILHYRDGLSIMTFNLRFDNPKDGENRWDNRRENVKNLAKAGV